MLNSPESIANEPLSQYFLKHVLVDLALAPAQRLIILLQTQPENTTITKISDDKVQHYGIRHYIKQIFEQEGLLAFWKGCSFDIIKTMVSKVFHSFFLHLYEPLLNVDDTSRTELRTLIKEFLLFCAVDLSLQVIQYPTRVIRVRLSALENPNESTVHKGFKRVNQCIKKIWDEDGFRGFYRGFGISLLESFARVTILTGERYLAHKFVSNAEEDNSLLGNIGDVARERSAGSLVSALSHITSTGRDIRKRIKSIIFQIAKGLGNILIFYPFKVIQRRIIMHKGGWRVKKTDVREVIREMWRKEGVRGFYSGLRMYMLFNFGEGIMFPVATALAGVTLPDMVKNLGNVGDVNQKVEETCK